MHDPDASRPPLFQTLPPLVVGLALLLAGVEAVFQLAAHGVLGGREGIGWRMAAMQGWGFSAPLFDQMVVRREFPAADLARFLSYGAMHASLVHALFAIVLLLALGKAVSERFSATATAVVMAAGMVAGALAYWAVLDGRHLLVGAYPAIYGLLGAFTWSLWIGSKGKARLLAFRLVALLIGLQVVFGLIEESGNIWVAEAGAFLVGFATAFLVAPDGSERLRRARARIRDL